MHLDLERETAKTFPTLEEPQAITSARIWMCKYRSLAPLADLRNLQTLEIANYPDETLEPVGELAALEDLRILHLPKVTDLRPLARLHQLRRLALETSPGWDSSGKVSEVESLDPLIQLPHLVRLTLYGVVPHGRSVDAIIENPSIRKVRVSKYPKAEVKRLLPVWDGPPPRGLSL